MAEKGANLMSLFVYEIKKLQNVISVFQTSAKEKRKQPDKINVGWIRCLQESSLPF